MLFNANILSHQGVNIRRRNDEGVYKSQHAVKLGNIPNARHAHFFSVCFFRSSEQSSKYSTDCVMTETAGVTFQWNSA